MKNSWLAVTLFFLSSIMALVAFVIGYARQGEVKLSLLAAALFVGAMGEQQRRRLASRQRNVS